MNRERLEKEIELLVVEVEEGEFHSDEAMEIIMTMIDEYQAQGDSNGEEK